MSPVEAIDLKIVFILAIGFSLATLLGYFSYKLKMSPILGYLLAGYIIGPYSPGLVIDVKIADQLAEIGVILMMFGVGLHFKWQNLMNVKTIALTGAIGQTLVSTLITLFFVYSMGMTIETGILLGFAIGVASTVVLVRILSDNHLLDTPEGHIAVGWLIVEDLITVGILILIPNLAKSAGGEAFSFNEFFGSLIFALVKFLVLVWFMFAIGRKVVSFVLLRILRTRSHELFTVAILTLTFVIAIGSSLLFDTSIALGAFMAGMVMGQTHVRHEVSTNSLPMKDAFLVIFFISVGMLFNPEVLTQHFSLFIGVLAIVLIIKPLTAILITVSLKYPFKTALMLGIALAQIGEFSFILAEQAMNFNIFPEEAYDVIVACALISISLNPLLFKWFLRKDENNLKLIKG